MVSKKAIAGIVFLIIIIGGLAYLENQFRVITFLIERIPQVQTLENTANGCDQYRNKCGFINIIISESSFEKKRVDGSFFQSVTFHVEPKSATGCLIIEFPDVCIDELDFEVNLYNVKQLDIERRLVTVFERDFPTFSNSASIQDSENECKLTRVASDCTPEKILSRGIP